MHALESLDSLEGVIVESDGEFVVEGLNLILLSLKNNRLRKIFK